MTRSGFWENITDWCELKEFCADNECDYCDDIYDEYDRNSEIDSDIGEYCSDYSWGNLRDLLNDIPSDYDYYRRNSAFDWEGADEGMFGDYKADVSDWADEHGVWEDECDAEDIDEVYENDDDESPLLAEDFSVNTLMGMCSSAFVEIHENNLQRIKEDKEAFERFVDLNIPKKLG